jgi:hypothetical protein
LDRALASGAKGCAFESHRGYFYKSFPAVLPMATPKTLKKT